MAALWHGSCYWRFKGEKAWRYGYASRLEKGLWRMGFFNGDLVGGLIVDPFDVEVR